jgi:NADPH:quinone reductase-like Zn-dependent oxidoreductase
MLALGLFGEKESLGYEASGVIRRIGPGVEAFQVGDKVALMGDGLLRTRRVVSGNYCVKIPAGLSLEDAATMLTVFATAIYSLLHVGCISKGKVCYFLSIKIRHDSSLTPYQSVLIHSACGGVGLASIQICKLVGAEVCQAFLFYLHELLTNLDLRHGRQRGKDKISANRTPNSEKPNF